MRARDLGIAIGRGTPGPNNAITDVTGVTVGHTTLIEGEGPLRVGEGPIRTGVTAAFAVSSFARQIARIELRLQDPILHVGNLGASRDFLDVRDVASAYRLILEEGKPGLPYNVASGTVWKIADLLQVADPLPDREPGPAVLDRSEALEGAVDGERVHGHPSDQG